MPKKIAFLGPIGTYTDEASYLYAPTAERVPFASLGLVTSALEEGNVDEAVVLSVVEYVAQYGDGQIDCSTRPTRFEFG